MTNSTAVYERIVIEGRRFIGPRLTPAAYRHGSALAPLVRILADGDEVWSGLGSNDPRPDAPGGNGFWVNLVELIDPDVQHVISVRAQEADTAEWVPLNQTPTDPHLPQREPPSDRNP